MSAFISPQIVALFFGSISICYGVRALVSPHEFANDFGFPLETPAPSSDAKSQPRNGRKPFVVATGGRTIALGVAITFLASEGQVRAAGTVVCCCALSGLIDAVSCYLAGTSLSGVLQHGIGTLVLATMGMWMRSE